jgi:hypothetical protein
MPLTEPPAAAGSLNGHPPRTLAGTELIGVWRRHLPDGAVRVSPWWFASAPSDPYAGGRFDLPAPAAACDLAQTAAGAVLEALQVHLANLPAAELAARGAVRAEVPPGMPPAADPTGTLRGATLFDQAGEHEPTHAGPWPLNEIDLLNDQTLDELTDVGVVMWGPGNLPPPPTP